MGVNALFKPEVMELLNDHGEDEDSGKFFFSICMGVNALFKPEVMELLNDHGEDEDSGKSFLVFAWVSMPSLNRKLWNS